MSDVFFIYRVNRFSHMTQGNSAVIGGNGIGFQQIIFIGQKMGKIHPSPRIVYVLFTKADFANKKMRLSAHIKEGWALYARPIELLIFVLAQW